MRAIHFLFFLLAATTVQAAGVGTAPSELHFSLAQGEKQQRELTVYNLGVEEAAIDAKSSADFISGMKTKNIAAGNSAKIAVEADASRLKAGQHEAMIYITTVGKASGVSLSIGTAVRATVDVLPVAKASIVVGTLTSAGVVIAGLVFYLALLKAARILMPAKA